MLGVLGGMGPLASAQFMLRLTLLTPATYDQDHIPTVLWSDPRVPPRVPDDPSQAEDPLPWMLDGVAGLRAAGCGAIVIPCNTAHGWYDAIREAAQVPVLHIVDAAASELRRLGIGPCRIGVIGTRTTLEMRLYQERLGAAGWDCLTPEPEEMAAMVTPAIRLVKANQLADAYAPLAEVVGRLGERGAAVVVLGCTEVPLGLQAGPLPAIPLVDTIDGLARAAIAWAQAP